MPQVSAVLWRFVCRPFSAVTPFVSTDLYSLFGLLKRGREPHPRGRGKPILVSLSLRVGGRGAGGTESWGGDLKAVTSQGLR